MLDQGLTLGIEGNEFALIVVVGGMLFVLTIIITSIGVPALVEMRTRRERERTKREISAYIAEGSITPQEGIEMLKAVGDDANPDADAVADHGKA